MIVSALSVLALSAVAVVVFGGLLLRIVGRIAVLAGLLTGVVDSDLVGLLVASVGGALIVLGSSRPLDRRRRRVS